MDRPPYSCDRADLVTRAITRQSPKEGRTGEGIGSRRWLPAVASIGAIAPGVQVKFCNSDLGSGTWYPETLGIAGPCLNRGSPGPIPGRATAHLNSCRWKAMLSR
jgi:hypothetical protein